MLNRQDYEYPFRIDPVSGQAMQTDYATHVDQMIRQVLLTDPGERICLPDFGCGLRNLVFAPNSDALAATAKMLITGNLTKWLGDQIQVQSVDVVPASDAPDPAQLLITINYILTETQTGQQALVLFP